MESNPKQRKGKSHKRKRNSGPHQPTPSELSASNGKKGRHGQAQSKGGVDRQPAHLKEVNAGTARPRPFTVSIAVPGSVVANAQNAELRTILVGQIARALAIYQVDEVVIYDDGMGSSKVKGVRDDSQKNSGWDPNIFMARVLQYMEMPQYLRKQLIPMHPDLRFVGLLAPLDTPHHVRAEEPSPFREGLVSKKELKSGCLVHVGLRKDVRLNKAIKAGVRVTVRIENPEMITKHPKGKAVAPSVPREESGLYWGYTTRLATSISEVFTGSPFHGGYDVTLGTSERGSTSVDDDDFAIKPFQHLLLVFGGVKGIEASIDNDEAFDLAGADSHKLFDMWVNTCPHQGSRTIRTEEAVLLSLARLSPYIIKNFDAVPSLTSGEISS